MYLKNESIKYYLIITAFLLSCSLIKGQAQAMRDTTTFLVMSYNVENLFDCHHDTLKDDYAFLPDAIRHWNYPKYKKKLDDVAHVIMAVGGWTPPALIALCEIENDSVLKSLTRYSALHTGEYRYILTSSEDLRGIDVALLYRRDLFKPIHRQSLRVDKPSPKSHPTRDILHVSGLLLNGDTLDVLVAHFPSRVGGARLTAPYREKAAIKIKNAVDSLFHTRKHAQIIVMGDFNDFPTSPLVQETLQAELPPISPESADRQKLYHLLARRATQQKRTGSYKYRGAWQWLDHILVSGNLLKENAPLHTSEARANVFSPPFLLTDDPVYGGLQPYRTYHGMKYQGGYSDHLPVYAVFTLIY